jgi:hypothetical protein
MGAVYVYHIYSGNKKKRRKLDFEELCLTPVAQGVLWQVTGVKP